MVKSCFGEGKRTKTLSGHSLYRFFLTEYIYIYIYILFRKIYIYTSFIHLVAQHSLWALSTRDPGWKLCPCNGRGLPTGLPGKSHRMFLGNLELEPFSPGLDGTAHLWALIQSF